MDEFFLPRRFRDNGTPARKGDNCINGSDLHLTFAHSPNKRANICWPARPAALEPLIDFFDEFPCPRTARPVAINMHGRTRSFDINAERFFYQSQMRMVRPAKTAHQLGIIKFKNLSLFAHEVRIGWNARECERLFYRITAQVYLRNSDSLPLTFGDIPAGRGSHLLIWNR